MIETRPFTIQPELYAWPSYRLHTRRIAWAYALGGVALGVLLWGGLKLDPLLSVIGAAIGMALFYGFGFLRYRSFLRRPQNLALFQNCVVSLTDDAVRQDYAANSYLEFKLFAVTDFVSSGGFFFVYATPRNAIVAPIAAFESAGDAATFEQFLRDAVRRR